MTGVPGTPTQTPTTTTTKTDGLPGVVGAGAGGPEGAPGVGAGNGVALTPMRRLLQTTEVSTVALKVLKRHGKTFSSVQKLL